MDGKVKKRGSEPPDTIASGRFLGGIFFWKFHLPKKKKARHEKARGVGGGEEIERERERREVIGNRTDFHEERGGAQLIDLVFLLWHRGSDTT